MPDDACSFRLASVHDTSRFSSLLPGSILFKNRLTDTCEEIIVSR